MFKPEVEAALRKCVGIIIPLGNQELDGRCRSTSAPRASSSSSWCRRARSGAAGPKQDIHSSLAAQVDSPAWHLVQALNTLVKADGHTPAVDGLLRQGASAHAAQKKILEDAIPTQNEAAAKKALGVEHWIDDESWHDSLVRLVSQPTINIEGLVGGYTGPGGKTILPHRAVAKIDMRLVPDMTAKGTLELLKAHLAKHGFGDIEVNMTGGYDPTETPADSKLVQGDDGDVPRSRGSSRCCGRGSRDRGRASTFTGAPLKLPAGHVRARARRRRACARRVLAHRVVEPEGGGDGRGGAVVRGFALFAGVSAQIHRYSAIRFTAPRTSRSFHVPRAAPAFAALRPAARRPGAGVSHHAHVSARRRRQLGLRRPRPRDHRVFIGRQNRVMVVDETNGKLLGEVHGDPRRARHGDRRADAGTASRRPATTARS